MASLHAGNAERVSPENTVRDFDKAVSILSTARRPSVRAGDLLSAAEACGAHNLLSFFKRNQTNKMNRWKSTRGEHVLADVEKSGGVYIPISSSSCPTFPLLT